MSSTSAGRAYARRLGPKFALTLALAYASAAVPAAAQNPANGSDATPPTRAQVSADNPATNEPSANTDASGAGESKEAALAAEAKWLSANVPKLGRAKVLIEVDARIGGTDVTVAKARASSPKIDKCVMTVDEIFERDEVGNVTGGAHIRQIVPLAHADPASVTVQQGRPNASSFGMISGQPWRVTFAMLDGSIRTDVNVWTDHSDGNDGFFDLFVADKQSGEQLVPHLKAAILACR